MITFFDEKNLSKFEINLNKSITQSLENISEFGIFNFAKNAFKYHLITDIFVMTDPIHILECLKKMQIDTINFVHGSYFSKKSYKKIFSLDSNCSTNDLISFLENDFVHEMDPINLYIDKGLYFNFSEDLYFFISGPDESCILMTNKKSHFDNFSEYLKIIGESASLLN